MFQDIVFYESMHNCTYKTNQLIVNLSKYSKLAQFVQQCTITTTKHVRLQQMYLNTVSQCVLYGSVQSQVKNMLTYEDCI